MVFNQRVVCKPRPRGIAPMRFRRTSTLIFALGLTTLVPAAHATPAEDPPQTVKDLVAQGMTEYTQQHWEAARVAFLKAWELNEHYAIGGSLADVEMKLGRYREAAQHLKSALANLPAEHAEKRAQAEASLAECRMHLSSVRLLADGMLVLVKLDNQVVPLQSMRDELLLDPGPHKLEAEELGYQPWTLEFTAKGGESREIRIALTPVPKLTVSHARPTSLPAPGETGLAPRTWVLIGGGAATVVAASFGTYFALRHHALETDFDRLRAETQTQGSPELVAHNGQCTPGAPMRPPSCDELADTADKRVTAANMATGSFITAGALGLATIVTYVLWPTKKGALESGTSVSLTPGPVGARGGALQIAF